MGLMGLMGLIDGWLEEEPGEERLDEAEESEGDAYSECNVEGGSAGFGEVCEFDKDDRVCRGRKVAGEKVGASKEFLCSLFAVGEADLAVDADGGARERLVPEPLSAVRDGRVRSAPRGVLAAGAGEDDDLPRVVERDDGSDDGADRGFVAILVFVSLHAKDVERHRHVGEPLEPRLGHLVIPGGDHVGHRAVCIHRGRVDLAHHRDVHAPDNGRRAQRGNGVEQHRHSQAERVA